MYLLDDNGEINFVTIAAGNFHERNLHRPIIGGMLGLAKKSGNCGDC
jgi:hypothetical protein